MNLFADELLQRIKPLLSELAMLPILDRIEAINEIKRAIHEYSPMASEPVDCILWVKFSDISANDYNPNSVAPPEMRLLEHSILEDGYTQPIVTWRREDQFEVVDGFHRNRVGRESPQVRERIHGYLPIAIINESRHDRGDRIAATIRHNRARGKHRIDSMSDIVVELKRRNWSDEKIGRELGMDADEVLRLAQITGLAEMFADREFSAAWEAQESSEINPDDNLSPVEEQHDSTPSQLPGLGGLESGDVPRDSSPSPTRGHRRRGKALANAVASQDGDAPSHSQVADSIIAESQPFGQEPTSLDRTSGLLFSDGGAGLPYETRVAFPLAKPASRRKRNRRSRD